MSDISSTFTRHRPMRTSVALSDAVAIRDHLDAAYGVPLRLRENRERTPDQRLMHARVDAGSFAVDDVHLPGDVEVSPDPLGKVVVLWATAGRFTGDCDGIASAATAGDVTMVAHPDQPHRARAEDLSLTSVLLDPAVVASVATGLPVGHAPKPLRFDGFAPIDAASARLWTSTVDYVKNCVLADDAMATPMVVGRASRMLAAVMLSTFPATAMAKDSRFDRIDTKPVLLRRAIEYMESNADADIALADIAEVIHVTPRAVQYMFRKHMDTTPLQYLRRARLHRAHRDLLNADRVHDTVTSVAARWGFAHGGRFAMLYREAYGQSPYATLRG